MKNAIYRKLQSHNKERPMSRYAVAKELNVNERTVRETINALRKDGIRVCSDSNGHGYWIAKSEEEYKRFRAEYVSRAVKIFETVGRMDASTEGQICL